VKAIEDARWNKTGEYKREIFGNASRYDDEF
jgi:hypothetical protein